MVQCPACTSQRVWKDGIRQTSHGDVQRYLCRNCGYRFSQTNQNRSNKPKHVQKVQSSFLNLPTTIPSKRQILRLEAKNLATSGPRQEKAQREGTTQTIETRGKIVEYLWYLTKRGLKESTVKHYGEKLNQLLNLGVNLLEPELIKAYLATNDQWSNRTKAIFVAVCDGFLKWLNIPWKPPKYKPTKKLPFIPTEQEIDQLIARAGKRLAPFLQLLKETGMRRGEAIRLKWTDIDFERKTVIITPLKGSNPRMLPLSEKAIAMLQTLPKKSEQIFSTLSSIASNFYLQRKTLARKLNNQEY